MGLQAISERKVRRAASETGLPIFRAMRHSNNLWFGWVREGDSHWHVEIDPATWDWEYEPGCQFSSCRENPGTTPSDPAVVAEHERREAERRMQRERKDVEAAAFIAAWTEQTKEWLNGTPGLR